MIKLYEDAINIKRLTEFNQRFLSQGCFDSLRILIKLMCAICQTTYRYSNLKNR